MEEKQALQRDTRSFLRAVDSGSAVLRFWPLVGQRASLRTTSSNLDWRPDSGNRADKTPTNNTFIDKQIENGTYLHTFNTFIYLFFFNTYSVM